MSRKINGTTNSSIIFPETLHLYSGSAEGVEFIRTALNIEYDPSIPPYSSALLFELRLQNSTYVLTVCIFSFLRKLETKKTETEGHSSTTYFN